MPSVTALSWNLQKFGEAKLKDPGFVNYVTEVIVSSKADIVGLMEIVGWIGNNVADGLAKSLTTATKESWKGWASEMTACRPDEQYVMLARSSKMTANPKLPPGLNTIVGGDRFSAIFTHYKIEPDVAQPAFWTAMMKHKYIDAQFQLSHAAWVVLSAPGAKPVDLGADFTMPPGMAVNVTAALVSDEPQMFPVRGARPPYYGAFDVAGSSTPLLVVLFHAPGPGSALPAIASNQIGLLPVVRQAAAGIVMGDFNVKSQEEAPKAAFTLQAYDFDKRRLMYVQVGHPPSYVATLPFQRLTGPKYSPAVPASIDALGYTGALPSISAAGYVAPPTSLIQYPLAPGLKPSAQDLMSARSSAYDRIFTVGATNPPSAGALDLLDSAIDAANKTTTTAPNPQMQTFLAEAYNSWWDRHKNEKSEATQQILANCPKLKKTTTFYEAFYAYRYAISDHLPVVATMSFT